MLFIGLKMLSIAPFRAGSRKIAMSNFASHEGFIWVETARRSASIERRGPLGTLAVEHIPEIRLSDKRADGPYCVLHNIIEGKE